MKHVPHFELYPWKTWLLNVLCTFDYEKNNSLLQEDKKNGNRTSFAINAYNEVCQLCCSSLAAVLLCLSRRIDVSLSLPPFPSHVEL